MDTHEVRWLDIATAAEQLGVSQRTIRRWEKSGEIVSKREGRRVYVDVSARLPQVDKTPAQLSHEVDSLRRELDTAREMIRRQDEEIAYLRQANILALRLQKSAIDAPDVIDQDESNRSFFDRLFGRD